MQMYLDQATCNNDVDSISIAIKEILTRNNVDYSIVDLFISIGYMNDDFVKGLITIVINYSFKNQYYERS